MKCTVHLRGGFPKFVCGEIFRAEYALNGDVSQEHTDRRDKSTCGECNRIYDGMLEDASTHTVEKDADAQ